MTSLLSNKCGAGLALLMTTTITRAFDLANSSSVGTYEARVLADYNKSFVRGQDTCKLQLKFHL